MPKELRIIFMGTPDFAVATLNALLSNNYNVVGVITAPDKPAGRGRKLNESAVKQFAKQHNLNILQPTNLKSEDFINQLKALHANLQIVVAFRMLPKLVWQLPEYGTFNLHASLLPDYRGAAPINWAIINGETQTGVTTFFIDEKIDTGEIILQETTNILPHENVGSLHDKLMAIGSQLVVKTVKRIENGNLATTPQSKPLANKSAYKLNKDNCKINWQLPAQNIYNLIRGLSPYPSAWSILNNDNENITVKIYDAEIELENHDYKIGQLISTKKELKVAVQNGFINIKNMQLPGKRAMPIKALLNGYIFKENSTML